MITVDDKKIKLYLAPMAGVTDVTFRMLCREQGADVTCTEMVSAKAMSFNNKKTFELLKKAEGESPVCAQLFGSDPELMAQAAMRIEDDFDYIDVNMGCPVAKIVGNGEGSALMEKPQLAEAIISAMVKKTKKPVTVKIRAGFHAGEITAPELAKRLEGAGAAAITVHGRTRDQMYSGKANRDVIARVVSSVKIPVIGNGDVCSLSDAADMVRQTGCAGVMIGRNAMGNPWIFSGTVPDAQQIGETVIRHAGGLIADKGEYAGVREMRKHAAWYTAGMPNSAAFRNEVCEIKTADALIKAVKEYFFLA